MSGRGRDLDGLPSAMPERTSFWGSRRAYGYAKVGGGGPRSFPNIDSRPGALAKARRGLVERIEEIRIAQEKRARLGPSRKGFPKLPENRGDRGDRHAEIPRRVTGWLASIRWRIGTGKKWRGEEGIGVAGQIYHTTTEEVESLTDRNISRDVGDAGRSDQRIKSRAIPRSQSRGKLRAS